MADSVEMGRMGKNSVRSTGSCGGALGWVLLSTTLAFLVDVPRCVHAQLFRGDSAQSDEDLFLLAPRELQRLLDEGKQAIAENRFSEGITALAALLADSGGEEDELLGQDYFIARSKPGYYVKSIKGEALRLLSNLPEEGRRSLEIQFGVAARQALDAAVAERDFEAVAVVARKFPHTEAGYDALVLLAQYKLASGYPLAAGSLMQSLLDYPAARQRFGVQLASATAVVMRQAGRKDVAVAILKRAERDFAGEEIKVNGRAIRMGSGATWSTLVDELSTQAPLSDDVVVDAWMTTGGTQERNAASSVGMPLPNPRWSERIHGSSKEEQAINVVAAEVKKLGKVILPKFELRMVDDLVMMKTTDNAIFARDFETGRLKWRFYFHNAPVDLNNGLLGGSSGSSDAVSMELKNRVWGSSAFGNFSCDSERLYFVSTTDEQPINSNAIFNFTRPFASTTNYLEGVGLAKEGSILWRIGGENGNAEPKLAGAYFLGPPLPFQDQLYSLLEINGETRLVVLDPETGKLIWQQQLLQSQGNVSSQDSSRRAMALSPTISDGIVVCPTGCGAVVAVDMQSRNLRWAKTYASNRVNSFNALRGGFQPEDNYDPLEERWAEPSVIAHQGAALITPTDANVLLCLDILTGESRWKAEGERRQNGRYVAGVNDNCVVVVGNAEVYAYQLDGKKMAWNLSFPKGQTSAGKGLWLGSSVLIPLSNQQVIKVDTITGKLLDTATVNAPLGNLFAYKEQLLSATPTAVSVFHTRESLEREIRERTINNPDEPWALNQRSQVTLAAGNAAAAVEMLEKSFQIDAENADTRFLLVETLLKAIETDFDKYQAIAQKYDKVFELSEQRFRYLQSVALGNVRNKLHYAAFVRLLELMKARLAENLPIQQRRRDMLTIAQGYEVDSDTWIATLLARTYANATEDEQVKMRAAILRELNAVSNSMLTTKRQLLRYFAWLPDAAPTVYLVARELIDEDVTAAERMIQPALLSSDKDMKGQAAELLYNNPIEDWFRLGPFGSYSPDGSRLDVRAPTLNGFSPSDPANNVAREEALLDSLQKLKPEWPTGFVEYGKGDPGDRVSELDTIQRSGAPPLVGKQQRYGRPRLNVRKFHSTVIVANELGQNVRMLNVDRGTGDGMDDFARCQIDGGLLMLETASELLALDWYRNSSDMDSVLWRHSLTSPAASPFREAIQARVEMARSPLGFSTVKRNAGPRLSVVGPLTPTGVVVQTATVISMLDALSGAVVWSRDGYSDQTRFAAEGLEVAVVEPSTGVTQILDCRDGHELRRMDFKGDWGHWFSHGPLMVDFKMGLSQKVGSGVAEDADNPSTIRIWNAFNGQEVQKLELAPRSRATVTDDRYVVAVEPTGAKTAKLHYFDTETLKYTAHEVTRTGNLDDIETLRFDDRLIVFSYDKKDWRESGNATVSMPQTLNNNVLAAGTVYGLSTVDGSQLWNRSAKLTGYFVPRIQPRNTPFLVAFRASMNPNASADSTLGLALIDLRDASLAFAHDAIPTHALGPAANAGQIAVAANPVNHTITVRFGATDIVFTCTDRERPPQPVFWFSSNGNKAAKSSKSTFRGFQLFGDGQ
ncbi:MAG: PQQ-binding-like beta-propeller repeat protein [Pirellulaceae bacterium]|nr:PQQ-binding-like beta-propeller repeat protein [Pirellulaceae bacterium]